MTRQKKVRRKPSLIPREAQRMVSRMSNWQRKRWARSGYPHDPQSLEHFVAIERSAVLRARRELGLRGSLP